MLPQPEAAVVAVHRSSVIPSVIPSSSRAQRRICVHPSLQFMNMNWRIDMTLRIVPAALALVAATAGAQQPAPAARVAGPTLIKNATVLTVTKGRLESTDVLLENGKIAQIGKNLSAPAGAQVIDATGKYVMPGIIDPHSHMMADAINEGSLSVTSMARIQDVLNPTAVNIYRALAG